MTDAFAKILTSNSFPHSLGKVSDSRDFRKSRSSAKTRGAVRHADRPSIDFTPFKFLNGREDLAPTLKNKPVLYVMEVCYIFHEK